MIKIPAHSIDNLHQTLTNKAKERPLLSLAARQLALQQLRTAVINSEERIYQALMHDLRRPHFESYAAEFALIIEEINVAQKNLETWAKRRHVYTPLVFQPGSSYIEPCPKGLVLIVAPWNYPFQLSLVPLISAIAAGNCAILKPSEISSASAMLISEIITNSLDPSCFQVVLGDRAIAEQLLDKPYDHIFYTGNTEVGREVMAKAARFLTPVTLELGGKSPCIIDESADLSLSAKRILWGKCLNAGQTCIAPDYVLIKPHLIDEFVKHAKLHLSSMFGENPQAAESFGRIINERHYSRLAGYLGQGRIVHGGHHDRADLFIEPTIMTDVDKNASLMTEEIFGPILPLVSVHNLDEAINFIDQRPHPLALYIFSTNQQVIDRVLHNTLSGSVAINDTVSQVGNCELPFGGVRSSGIGAYHGHFGFETFSHMRAIYRRANMLDLPIKYPPYTEKKLNLVKLVL